MREHRLFVKLSKCESGTQRVQYLGFVIEPAGVSPDPDKVRTISEWPEILRDRRQLRGFLGLVGYYRRVIPNLNKLAHPLRELLREESDMVWRGEHSQAVAHLKDALRSATAVQIFDPDRPIVIKTDASTHAIGAVMKQDGVPVAFESKKSGEREKLMPAYESELRAIVHALTKWKQFIGSKPVTIETDHATLSRLLKQKQVTTKLGYWLDKLADFNLNVVYKPGKQNVVADAISRRPDFVGVITRGQAATDAAKQQFSRGGWAQCYEKCDDFKDVRGKFREFPPSSDNGAAEPKTDGQSERTNKTIKQILRCALRADDKKWAKVLPLLEFAYNSTQHSSSKHAPFELLYGSVPPKPVCQQLQLLPATAADLLPLQRKIKIGMARRELLKAQEFQKKYADLKRRPVEFKQGQRVFLKSTNLSIPECSKALRPRFVGPFRIVKMVGKNAAMLDLPVSWLVHPVFHASLLLPAEDEPSHLRRAPPVQDPVVENE
ncbi:transposon tf2-1 polyprotein [Cystoisospora suis]|uniref:Transposon tf2-1 polyprotein n=1 Tax=Cystoisospora suis TaxID=483139 RepID=A0A2C6L593_9APIC|nr:transposon tf2-1 polyprotein [Cystoisospora suis]